MNKCKHGNRNLGQQNFMEPNSWHLLHRGCNKYTEFYLIVFLNIFMIWRFLYVCHQKCWADHVHSLLLLFGINGRNNQVGSQEPNSVSHLQVKSITALANVLPAMSSVSICASPTVNLKSDGYNHICSGCSMNHW